MNFLNYEGNVTSLVKIRVRMIGIGDKISSINYENSKLPNPSIHFGELRELQVCVLTSCHGNYSCSGIWGLLTNHLLTIDTFF